MLLCLFRYTWCLLCLYNSWTFQIALLMECIICYSNIKQQFNKNNNNNKNNSILLNHCTMLIVSTNVMCALWLFLHSISLIFMSNILIWNFVLNRTYLNTWNVTNSIWEWVRLKIMSTDNNASVNATEYLCEPIFSHRSQYTKVI